MAPLGLEDSFCISLAMATSVQRETSYVKLILVCLLLVVGVVGALSAGGRSLLLTTALLLGRGGLSALRHGDSLVIGREWVCGVWSCVRVKIVFGEEQQEEWQVRLKY